MSEAEDLDLGVQLRAEQETNLLLQESIADLELALEDQSWDRVSTGGGVEFSGGGRRMIVSLCRSIAVVNPLVKRGLMLRIAYIWGGGVEVAARDEKVAEVIGDFWDDNARALTSTQATEELERALGTDGNVYLAAFTSPLTGRVQVRSTPTDEIVDIVTNPEDRDEPWFYRREYTKTTFGQGGTSTDTATETETIKVVHPALGYRPARRIKSLDGADVMWDAPMLHVSVNRLDGWSYGVPDVYAAMAWARAYKDFLTDWALLNKSLAKFAWKLTGDTKTRATKAIEAARSAVEASGTNGVTGSNLNTAGQIAGTGPGMSLEAIPKSGAHIDADSGKPLAAMVAAGLGVPVTLLLADPGITGARAVAETLDKPTVLEMGLRRMMWQDQLTQLLDYVIDQAVIAPKGRLQGTVRVDDWGRRQVELANSAERTLDWEWPPLAELDPIQLVGAITTAADYLPDETTTRLLLTALGVKDVDEILDDMRDEAGNFVPPRASMGQAAADAFNRGEDPAELTRGTPPDPAAPAGGGVRPKATEALVEADHVYHFKHGWIPLDHAEADAASPGGVTSKTLPVSEVEKYRMDKDLNEEHVAKLTAQMKAAGKYVGPPLLVEETRTTPLLTDGHHRLEAAKRAGIKDVPVDWFDATPAGQLAALKRLNQLEREKDAVVEADRVYHYKHGWIPLDHVDAGAAVSDAKVAKLEAQAARANPTPSATGDPAYAATGIVNNHRVRVVKRGYDQGETRYEVTAPDGTQQVFTDRAAALAWMHRSEGAGPASSIEARPPAPVTLKFMRNPQSLASNQARGHDFGQDIEPAGRYLTEAPEGSRIPDGWQSGTVHFDKPLHIEFGGGYTEADNWKRRLSAHYGGKTGKALTAALRKDGYDAIITHDKYGTAEIVDLGR